MDDFTKGILTLVRNTEFWSAIAGAIVGGLIALATQLVSLRAEKKQRAVDRLHVQQALGKSLLFKVARIHSNIYGIHHHLEFCYKKGEELGEGRPWVFFMLLAGSYELVTFSADEMGMLLDQKDNDVFNSVMDLDIAHNNLTEVFKLASLRRSDLTDRLRASEVEGVIVSGSMSKEEASVLRPKMLEVNSLIENARASAAREYQSSLVALEGLSKLLKRNLQLPYDIELTRKM